MMTLKCLKEAIIEKTPDIFTDSKLIKDLIGKRAILQDIHINQIKGIITRNKSFLQLVRVNIQLD